MRTTYVINDFEGPLDLLLHLIKENKMDILDIKITLLIDQYLDYIRQAQEINLEIASEFLLMASQLLEIKSKHLLPKPDLEFVDEYEEDNEQALINQLIQYQQYQNIVKDLKLQHQKRQEIYIKPETDLSYLGEVIKQVDVKLLEKSMIRIINRKLINKPTEKVIEKKEYDISYVKDKLLDYLAKHQFLIFEDYVEDYNISYLITCFIAILDLAKINKVHISQEDYIKVERVI